MKQGHIGLDSAFDLWLLGHFKLRIFRLSHGASRTGVCSLVLSLTVETRGLRKSLTSQWIGKITTQRTKTSKVNTVSCILLNILASIYRFESFT